MRIGVVGYSSSDFDIIKARLLVELGIEYLVRRVNEPYEVTIVSGWTNLGIPALAYEVAEQKQYGTVGIACSKATDYECFPVDRHEIVGDNWGDESKAFIEEIDCLLRVGGGDQSHKEVKLFRKTKPWAEVLELELEKEKQK